MNEIEQRQLNEGRMLRTVAPTLMPMLEQRLDGAKNRLIMEFKQGTQGLSHLVAELAVLQDLINELSRKEKQTQHTESKYHGIK